MSKIAALRHVTVAATAERADAARARNSRRARDAKVLEAAEAGASQREIAEAMGVTIDRITQVLRQQRDLRHA